MNGHDIRIPSAHECDAAEQNRWTLAHNKAFGLLAKGAGKRVTATDRWKRGAAKASLVGRLESKVGGGPPHRNSQQLAHYLRVHAQEKALRVGSMHVEAHDGALLGDFLRINVTVQKVEISGNALRAEGAKAIAAVGFDV